MARSKSKKLRVDFSTGEAHKATEDEWAKAGPVSYHGHISQALVIGLPGQPQPKVVVKADKHGNVFLELIDES
jgi:hypothetical protein